jgi:hypothetical protein
MIPTSGSPLSPENVRLQQISLQEFTGKGLTRDLLKILDAIAKAGATFKALADTWPTPRHRTAG